MPKEGSSATIDGVSPLIGYTVHQTDHNNSLWLAAGDERLAERRRLGNENEENLELFLKWVKETFNPQLIYYPFSGWHIGPRQIFGEDNVVHLSDDKCHPHLKDIEQGQRVIASAQTPPFGVNTFDAVFVKGDGLRADEGLNFFEDLRNLVKPKGLFIINATGVEDIVKISLERLERLWVPPELKRGYSRVNYLFENYDFQVR